ncbi:DUF4097 family beta strand repeat protein [Candidatus Fermentibacterales bacterium]|nr:DUF4097 family beta strand repeat protein [Candidatus Fermentibacterales bacterium]
MIRATTPLASLFVFVMPLLASPGSPPPESALYEIADGEVVSIENINGDIFVEAWGEPRVRVDYDFSGDPESSGISILVDTSDGVSYSVEPDEPVLGFLESVDFSVSVPSDIEVGIRLSAVSGDIVLEGCNGSAELNTVSGDIVADGFDGVLEANAVSGVLALSGCNRICCAAVVSGDMNVDLSGITSDCELNAVDGDLIILFDPERSRVVISTISGDVDGGPHAIRIEESVAGLSAFAGSGSWTIEVSTISGDVELR